MVSHQTHTLAPDEQHSGLVELFEEIAQEAYQNDEEGIENRARGDQRGSPSLHCGKLFTDVLETGNQPETIGPNQLYNEPIDQLIDQLIRCEQQNTNKLKLRMELMNREFWTFTVRADLVLP